MVDRSIDLVGKPDTLPSMPRVNDPDPPPLMAPRARNPAPQHNPVFIWPTPNHADYLFWVEKNGDLPKNQSFAYGDAYSDSVKYPNHKLVFVSPQTEEAWSRWFYASDRINQDEYNWNSIQADLGGVKFDAVERLYLYKRTDFKHADTAQAEDQGNAMPDVPEGQFPASTYLLSERVTMDAPAEELRSLYILEKRTYFLRSTIATVEHEDMLGIGQGSVVTLFYRGETPTGAGATIETLINAPSNAYWEVQSTGEVRTGQQLSHRWFAVSTLSSLDTALAAYKLSFPSSVDIDIPDELVSISTVWNSAGANGSFASDAAGRSAYVGDPEVSLSLSESANAECGGSIQPEIIPIIRSRKGRDIPSTAWFFYIKSTATTLSAADVLAKLTTLAGATVLQWPMFQPVQHTFLLKGQRGSGRAQVSASGSVSTQKARVKDPDTGVLEDQERNNKEVSSAKGTSFDYSTSFGTVVLPPTIHGAITVSNTSAPSATYTADCSVGWTPSFTAATVATYSIALPTPAESGPGTLDPTSGVAGEVSETATVALTGAVSPASLAATTPAAIPTSGLYMVGSPRVEPYKARWFKCSAQVINANVLAP